MPFGIQQRSKQTINGLAHALAWVGLPAEYNTHLVGNRWELTVGSCLQSPTSVGTMQTQSTEVIMTLITYQEASESPPRR